MCSTGSQAPQTILRLTSFEPAFAVGPEAKAAAARRFSSLLVEESASDARGGTSYVCRAATTDGMTLAVKRLRPLQPMEPALAAIQEQGRRRAFYEEYKSQLLVAQLKGFPQLFGYGEAQGEPLILMEWVEGITLKNAASLLPHEAGGCTADTVADLGISVLEVLWGMTRLNAGLVHRDISPRNIMLRGTAADIEAQAQSRAFDVVLIDFGSATTPGPADSSLTFSADIWRNGTPEYAPPEMLTHDVAAVEGLRSASSIDVYALCSVLFELYSGRTPFQLSLRGGSSAYRVKTEAPLAELVPRHERDRELCEAIMSGIRASQQARPELSELLGRLYAWRDGTSPVPGMVPGVTPAALIGRTPPVATTRTDGTPTAPGPVASPKPVPSGATTPPEQHAAAGRQRGAMTRRGFLVALGAAAAAGVGAAFAQSAGLLGPSSARGRQAESDTNQPQDDGSITEEAQDKPAGGDAAASTFALAAKDASSGLWGLISADGNWLVDPAYPSAPGSWSAHGTPAQDAQSGLWGYLAGDGGWAISPSFLDAGPFSSDGHATARSNTGWGIIAGDGSWSTDPIFVNMNRIFTNGAVAAAKSSSRGSWGLVDASGSWLVKPQKFSAFGSMSAEGLASACVSGSLWGYVRTDGSWSIQPTLYAARAFSEGLAACRPTEQDGWTFIDTSGSTSVQGPFADARPFSEGVSAVQDPSSGLWGFIDASGTWAAAAAFSALGDLRNGVAPAQMQGGAWGLVDSSGAWVIDPVFSELSLGPKDKDLS